MKNRICIKPLKYGTTPDKMYNQKQLKMGIKVETEHTSSKKLAKQIAKAHLHENPAYYSFLKRMESSKSFKNSSR